MEERHISLMSLGAAIGVGLFLGSASAIKLAGPGILAAYACGGLIMFFIMRALGKWRFKACSRLIQPVCQRLPRSACRVFNRLELLVLWVVTCMAEITAVGIYMGYWFPDVPSWIWALCALVIMTAVNFLAVKAYGELEFWFALIKVLAILSMIAIGLVMIVFGLGNGGVALGISNLWSHGGFFPNGIKGCRCRFKWSCLPISGLS